MKLLVERTDFKYNFEDIQKSKDENNGRLVVKGIIQRANTVNQNGRIYPREVLLREINNYMALVKERKAMGELDHTDEPIVNLKNVSHIISDMWLEGDVVYGAAEILPTPSGNILKSLIESNITVGISSRALGSVHHNGQADIVQDDLHFICWDFVSEPSTPGAYMMKEAKEVDPKLLKQIYSREYRVDRVANDLLKLDEIIKTGNKAK